MDYTADYQLDRLLKMGAGSDTQFANNVCRILLNGLPVKVKPEGACSSFVASTPDGHKLFARNFDYKSAMAILIKAFPKKGYRSVALSNLWHMYYDSITQWSVVYDLSKCTAAAAVKSDFERKYDLSIS